MVFESINTAGFSILEHLMTQIHSSNALNRLVIDLGYCLTDISAIYDGCLLHQAWGALLLRLRCIWHSWPRC